MTEWPGLTVRRLLPEDAPAYRAARLAALIESPAAFFTRADEYARVPLAEVAARLGPGEDALTLGAFLGDELVGMVTLAREERRSRRHRAGLTGMAVLRRAQGHGVGRALLHAAIARARAMPGVSSLHLSVMETQAAARRLYASAGFTVWGSEPEGSDVGGVRLRAHWMWLPLEPPPTPRAD